MGTLVRSLTAAMLLASPAAPSWATDTTSGALDGMVFVGVMDVANYDEVFEDRLTFKQGRFVSAECQRVCDFGETPYVTRNEGNSIAFSVTTRCKEAPHSVQWQGRVTGDRIEGTVVWTVNRFYWTVQRHGTFSGRLEPATERQSSNAIQ